MTYCIDFFRKFKKDGNFCGLDKSQVSRLNSYLEFVELLMKQQIPEETVYTNFPVKAAEPLISAKGDARTDGLNFATAALKEGKRVTQKDMQSTLSSCINATAKPAAKPVQQKEPEPQKSEKPPKKSEAFCYQPGEIKTTDAPPQPSLAQQQAAKQPETPPAPPRAPCLSGDPCPRGKVVPATTLHGKRCGAIMIDLNQLPDYGTGIQECPVERNARLKGTAPESFSPASRLDAAKPLVERPPYNVVPVQLTRQQAEDAIRGVVRGYLTKAQQGIWEDIRKSGECGESDLEIFEAMLDRMGAA